MIATHALKERGASSRDEILEALSGHVCRCTGYVKIVDAAQAALNGDVDTAAAEPDMGPHDEDEVQLIPGSPA